MSEKPLFQKLNISILYINPIIGPIVQIFFMVIHRKIDGFTLMVEYQIGNLMPYNIMLIKRENIICESL